MSTATNYSFVDVFEVNNTLSTEPVHRNVELAFLRRLTDKACLDSFVSLNKADKSDLSKFASDFEAMQRPLFRSLAAMMESRIPESVGFGKFRGRNL